MKAASNDQWEQQLTTLISFGHDCVVMQNGIYPIDNNSVERCPRQSVFGAKELPVQQKRPRSRGQHSIFIPKVLGSGG